MKKYVFVLTLILGLFVVFTPLVAAAEADSWDIPEWTGGETEDAEQSDETQKEGSGDETEESAQPVKDDTAAREAKKEEKKGEMFVLDNKIVQGVVMSADAALACWAVYALFDLKSAEVKYDERLSAVDPVLADSDERLAELMDEKEAKGVIAGVAAGIAAAAIAYTITDFLYLHIVFPAEVKVSAVPGGAVLSAEIKF